MDAKRTNPIISALFIHYLRTVFGHLCSNDDLPKGESLKSSEPTVWDALSGHIAYLTPLFRVLYDHETTGRPISNEPIDADHPRWPNTRPDLVSAINGMHVVDNSPLAIHRMKAMAIEIFTAIGELLERSDEQVGDAQLMSEVKDRLGYELMVKFCPSTKDMLDLCLDAYQNEWQRAKADFLNPSVTTQTTAFRLVRNSKPGGAAKKPTKYVVIRTRSSSPRFFTYACWWAHQQDGSPNVMVVAEREDGNVLLSSGMTFKGFEDKIAGLAVDENDTKQAFVPKESQPDGTELVKLIKKAVEDGDHPLFKAVPTTSPVNTAVPLTSPSPRPPVPSLPRPLSVLEGRNPAPAAKEPERRPTRRGKGLTHNPFAAALATLKPAE